MKKMVLSAFACIMLAGTMNAADAQKKKSFFEKEKSVFTCAGEIRVVNARGDIIARYPFSRPDAVNHRDCLNLFDQAVAAIDLTLKLGETTQGNISYL